MRDQVDLLHSVQSARKCPFVISANVHHRQTQTKTDMKRLSPATKNGSVSAGTKISINP